jgi:hypothetical protein
MGKIPILFLALVLLVNPASAQQTGRNPRASQVTPKVTKLQNAYNRMNRANKQSDVASQSDLTKNPFNPFSSVNPTVPGTPSAAATSALVPGDRPFDTNVPANNPFGPSTSSSISPPNPPVAFGPGVDPFSPAQLTVNPFISGGPSPASPFSVSPRDASGIQGISPGYPMNTSQNAPITRKAPLLKLNPLEGFLHQDTPLSLNPYSLLSVFDTLSAYGNPYSTSLSRGSIFQPLASP